MSSDRSRAVAALLAEAESAHGVFEATQLGGVRDEAWPRWYAGYVVDRGLGTYLGRQVGVDEVAGVLDREWAKLSRAEPKPPGSWAEITAPRLLAELGS